MLMFNSRRGQVWSFDLIVALVIFVIGLLIIYFYALNYQTSTFDDLGELYHDADIVSDVILTDSPEGLSSDGRLNQTKIDAFDSLTSSEMKIRLGVSSNFYFTIPSLTVNDVPQDTVGILNSSPISSQVKISRVVIYKNAPVKMEVLAWR